MSYSASNSQPSSPKISSNSAIPFASNFALSTPSQIIKEAREKLHESKRNNTSSGNLHRTSSFQHSKNTELSSTSSLVGNGTGGGGSAGLVRTLNSTRPFTPRDEKRSLFGPNSTRHINERPSSSYSQIGSKSFDQTDVLASSINSNRPLSATRLSPIEKHSTTSNTANKKNNISTKQHPQSSLTQNEIDSLLFISSSSSHFQNSNSNNTNNSSRINSSQSLRSNSGRLAPLDVTSLSTNKSIEKKKKSTQTTVNTKNGPTTASNVVGTTKTMSNNSNPPHLSSSQQEQVQEDVNFQANWLIHIQPLLNNLETYFKENNVDEFCESCDRLNTQLDSFQMFSKTCPRRAVILKLIFKYLDTESDRIKLRVSKIILNMKVSSNNLVNICRLLFSISRNSDNDGYFLENDLLDVLLVSGKRLEFKENSDAVVYFCGTVKNLSENNKILKHLASRNLEELLLKLFKELSKYYKDNEKLKTEAGHGLVQLTATLRNLADLPNTRQKFLALNLIEQLVNVLKYYTSDGELMLNVSRILSKLTLHSDCCQELALKHQSCYKSFIKIMIKHDSKQDLIVRIAFIIGNLTSRHEDARVKFINEKYSIDTLVNTLKVYFANDKNTRNKDILNLKLNPTPSYKSNSSLNETGQNTSNNNNGEPNPNEDVMIKLIRVVANLAINENAGYTLSNRQDLLDILLRILETKEDAGNDALCEELLIDAIVTINNLSFYNSEVMFNYSKKIIDCLMKYLLSTNMDAVLEVFRVFANLSREQSIRNYLVNRKVNVLAIAYLSSPNKEMVFIVIGVLINIMTDPENRLIFKKEKGVSKMIEILNEVGIGDWQLTSMICKVLMNYSEKTRSNMNYSYFEIEELNLLQMLLSELLDEKFALHRSEFNGQGNENGQEANEDYVNTNNFLTSSKSEVQNDPENTARSTNTVKNDQDANTSIENIDDYMNYLWKNDFCPVASLLLKRVEQSLRQQQQANE